MAMRRIGVTERRARLVRRHRLTEAARAGTPEEVARDLVALHATDPASVYLAVAARQRDPRIADVERALYEDRALVRMLGMRRTMFVVPVDLAPAVEAACARTIAERERARLVRDLELHELGDAAWLAAVEESTVRALRARGQATGAELSTDEPRLRSQILASPGKAYEALQTITTRVLMLLAAEGRIVRGRPRGTWMSTQYRWSPVEDWLPDGMPEWHAEDARAELVRRWLAAFGPGTVEDVRWWTGLTLGQVRKALARVGAAEVDLGGNTGVVAPADLEPVPSAAPEAALLPALDPTAMGWSGRDWYLGEHRRALVDRSGNIGPTVWWDGRIVGGWAQRANGEVVHRLLEDVGGDGAAAVASAAGRLTSWLDGVRVTPRFRPPLELELSRG